MGKAKPTPAEEVETLREATREAHEAMTDMRALMRQMTALKTEVEEVAATVFGERMDVAVKAGLDEYATSIATAIENATQAVYKRFDGITAILLGDGKGDRSIEALARRHVGDQG